MAKTETVKFRVTREEVAAIEALADSLNINKSQAMRIALKKLLTEGIPENLVICS